MNTQELAKELIEQITSGASESDVIQILYNELQEAFFQGQDGRYSSFDDYCQAE